MPRDHHEDEHHAEERFRREEKQMAKKERKIASSTDRSKFKKTDQKMVQKSSPPKNIDNLLRGRVISIIGQVINVLYEKELFRCVLRGLLKKEKNQQKNIVAVGDYVLFEPSNPQEGVIEYVEPRTTVLSRADNLSRRKEQLIASNIDQVLITVSVMFPPLKTSIIDRYIIATRKGGMEPVIVINKIDILDDTEFPEETRAQQRELLEDCLEIYPKANIPIVCVSASSGKGLDELRQVMQDKSSVFSGQSGVGKSSLINSLTDYQLRVGGIVEKTLKGSHTTTKAELMPLAFGGWCIDTPGIKSFGLWQLKREDVEHYFPEISELSHACKYQDCRHLHEVGCAVLPALEKGEVAFSRFESYQILIDSLSAEHRPR